MKEIELTKGFVTQVDNNDYNWLIQSKWFVMKGWNTWYAATQIKLKNGKYKILFMHRVILDTPKALQGEHIDRNGLNNQRSNLRNATRAQNRANTLPGNNKKYKGTLKHGKQFISQIRINGTTRNLGSFKTEEEAAKKYDLVAKDVFGEFAYLNFR